MTANAANHHQETSSSEESEEDRTSTEPNVATNDEQEGGGSRLRNFRDTMRKKLSIERGIVQCEIPAEKEINSETHIEGDDESLPSDTIDLSSTAVSKMQRRFSMQRISHVRFPSKDANVKHTRVVSSVMLKAMLSESEPKRSRTIRRSTMDLLGPALSDANIPGGTLGRRLSLDFVVSSFDDNVTKRELGVTDSNGRHPSDAKVVIPDEAFTDDGSDSAPWNMKVDHEVHKHVDLSPNSPHPSIEYPPLYFILKRFPCILNAMERLYKVRWEIQYPLQRRVPFSKKLRKIGITATWGECLLMVPFIIIFIQGVITSFVHPSVSKSGLVSRLPLIICFLTSNHNSLLTLLLGIPFERAIKYHKISGYLSFLIGGFHTYVAWVAHKQNIDNNGEILSFVSNDQVQMSGTLMLCVILSMIITASPYVRRKAFEVFYYFHIFFAMAMMGCAFYHSGIVVPVVASILWGGDLIVRQLYMARFRYPRTATISQLTDTVVELRIPKTSGFDYNPGQVSKDVC